MPRCYERKTQRGSYSEEDLRKAIEALKSGALLKATSIAYGILPRAFEDMEMESQTTRNYLAGSIQANYKRKI